MARTKYHVENTRMIRGQRKTPYDLGLPIFRGSILENPFTLQHLINKRDPVVVEVGCNDGLDTKNLMQVLPSSFIYCFEPEPSAIAEFKKNLKGNRRHQLIQSAVGSENGTATFHQSSGKKENTYKENWNLSGSLNKPTGHKAYSPWVKFVSTIEVPVRTLDSVVNDYFRSPYTIDLLWIDVQGGEKNVLLGGPNALARTRYIYLEFGHWRQPLYEGQMNLGETIKQLGDQWVPLGIYENCNLFAANKEMIQT